jgi:hypothetical protein
MQIATAVGRVHGRFSLCCLSLLRIEPRPPFPVDEYIEVQMNDVAASYSAQALPKPKRSRGEVRALVDKSKLADIEKVIDAAAEA